MQMNRTFRAAARSVVAALTLLRRDPDQLVGLTCIACLAVLPLVLNLEGMPS